MTRTPNIVAGVPYCSERCPQFDGKRCRESALRVRHGDSCAPAVVDMSKTIDDQRTKIVHLTADVDRWSSHTSEAIQRIGKQQFEIAALKTALEEACDLVEYLGDKGATTDDEWQPIAVQLRKLYQLAGVTTTDEPKAGAT